MMNMSVSRIRNVFGSLLSAASLVAFAMLVLTLLTGATDVARNYAALMETQVRQHLWMALIGNPLAWVCLILCAAICVVGVSLAGYLYVGLRATSFPLEKMDKAHFLPPGR